MPAISQAQVRDTPSKGNAQAAGNADRNWLDLSDQGRREAWQRSAREYQKPAPTRVRPRPDSNNFYYYYPYPYYYPYGNGYGWYPSYRYGYGYGVPYGAGYGVPLPYAWCRPGVGFNPYCPLPMTGGRVWWY
jgi:hypothetical protein